MEQLSYLEYLVFSLFSTKKPRKMMTVFHILTGKRTASILYQAEIYQLSAYFSLFTSLKKEHYQKIIQKGLNLDFLSYANDEKNTLILTNQGEQKIQSYFANHFVPKNLDMLHYGRWLSEFWCRISFLSQVLSEARYENLHYIPIEKDWRTQIWVKKLLQNNQAINRSEFAYEFGKEWLKLGRTQIEKGMAVLTGFLTGHELIGQTTQQIAHDLDCETSEVKLILLDTLCGFVDEIKQNDIKYPIFFQIQQELEEEIGATSSSVRKTIAQLKNGFSLSEITQMRALKLSTISEHIIEFAIVDATFSATELIGDQPFKEVMDVVRSSPEISYSDVQNYFSNVPFYVYRLAQLERWRKDNEPERS